MNRHRITKTMLLICVMGLLPVHTFAQPLAEGKDKFLGCATSSYIYRYLDRYFNQLTPGNSGKWQSVETIQGFYNWENLDKIYNFAVRRNLHFKEHTLVWGQQQPSWVASLDSSGQRSAVENWIHLVGERYPLMASVDVVNEPIHAPPVYKDALGGDGATGWDWVITAFQWARQYCAPGVKLILNEYNILHSDTATDDFLGLIDTLMVRGLIDVIGIQGHYFEFRSHVDATSNIYVHNINTIKSNLDRLATTGLHIYISEFDIDESDDMNQLEQYKIYFPIFWRNPGVKGITFWGYMQGDVWNTHPDTYLLLADETERPALQWLRTFIASPSPPVLVSPDLVVDVPRDPLLVWHSSESATSYHVQIASNSVFATIVSDSTVADTLLQPGLLEANKRYYWHVSAVNEHGESEYSAAANFMTGEQITAVEEPREMPGEFELFQNYPNPFNPATTISFRIPERSYVRLILLNVLGVEVMNIAEGYFEPGVHHVQLNASGLDSGTYFYRMEAGRFVTASKIIVMK